MDIESIDKEIKDIDNQIEILKKKKEFLLKEQILSAKTFEEQFKYWYEHSEKKHLRDVPDRNKYPLIRKWIEHRDFRRYQTVNICEYMEDDFAMIYDDNWRKECFDKNFTNKEKYDEVCKLAKELMDNNIGSFTLDW